MVDYTTKLGLAKQAQGENTGNWDDLERQDRDRIEERLATSYAGDPNGNVIGYFIGQYCWDSTNSILYACTTDGDASTAVWAKVNTPANVISSGYLDTDGTAPTTAPSCDNSATDGLAIGNGAVVAAAGTRALSLGASYSSGADALAAQIGDSTSTYGAQAANAVALGYRAKVTGARGFVAGGSTNTCAAPDGAIVGGISHSMDSESDSSFVGGGGANTLAFAENCAIVGSGGSAIEGVDANNKAEFCAIVGGSGSTIDGETYDSGIFAGSASYIGTGCYNCAIVGGGNTIDSDSYDSVLLGSSNVLDTGAYNCALVGYNNSIGDNSQDGTILGSGSSLGASTSACAIVGNASIADNCNYCYAMGRNAEIEASTTGATLVGYDGLINSGANYSTGLGYRPFAYRTYSTVLGLSNEAPSGYAIQKMLIGRGATTTNSTPTALTDIVIPSGTVWAFCIWVMASRSDTGGTSAAYKIEGAIDNHAGTVALLGTPTKTVLGEDNANLDVAVTADDTDNALVITVTGDAGHTYKWGATVELNELLLTF